MADGLMDQVRFFAARWRTVDGAREARARLAARAGGVVPPQLPSFIESHFRTRVEFEASLRLGLHQREQAEAAAASRYQLLS